MKKYLLEIIIVVVTVIFIVFISNIETEGYRKNLIVTDTIPEVEPEIELVWGYVADSVVVDTFKVKRNQSLSDILRPKGITPLQIDRIARKSKGVFDVRRIKAGKTYYLLNTDSVEIPNVLVYRESLVDYVVFDFDSLSVFRGQKVVDTVFQAAGGVIESSLWNAFVDNGASPVLAVELSDIYAWTVDFFGIQKGDRFKVLFDELYTEGEYVGIGTIHAAVFTHHNQDIHAYLFNKDEQTGYFDDEGNSLRKAFLKAPLKYSRISSHFSHSRMHPVLRIRRPHRGVDYAAPSGTPVYSIGDGVVVKKNYQKRGGGNYLNIKHNSVYTSQYMHLKGYAKGIATGVRVKQGQLIGYVGKTGLATGPHLDFRIFKNGSAVNPLNVKAPPVEPISDANKSSFIAIRDSLKLMLDEIPLPQKEILAVE